jgi:uncharacterized protein (TIGR00255 family)
MKSMTGYGQARLQTSEVSIEISLRAVNGRFLENRFHLPRCYFSFESDLKKKLSTCVRRGTVDVYISRKLKANITSSKVVMNTKLAEDYLKAFQKLSKSLKMSDPIKFDLITRQADIIQIEEQDQISATEVSGLKKTFELALNKFETERKREGQALKNDLRKNIKDLQKYILKVSKLREDANKMLYEKFEAKLIARIPKGVEMPGIDAQRLTQEIVIQLEKSDINEEIIRLNEHLKNFEKIIDVPVVEGKKLDFYTQELLREVNTIGSKSQIAGITESIVESKTLIERIREQVQNVE